MLKIIFILSLILSLPLRAQGPEQFMQEIDNDLSPGTDIFSDFNEDIESAQVLEDERFYRYGRFFSVNIGGGFTTFTGNRGSAFEDNNPTFHLSVNYFLDFQNSIILGIEYSKHTMVLDSVANGFPSQGILGAVVDDMTRVFVGYKYYIDTSDLGTALTYSNPHFIGRMEYWYRSRKFIDLDTIPKDVGGGLGTGIGMGLEFPIELKESYVSVEALYHVVNFDDKFTQDFRQIPDEPDSTFGYEDLTGNVITFIITYNFTW